MKKNSANLLLMIISVSIALVVAEVAAQIYVSHIALKGKLFIPDPVAGWSTKPNIDIKRKLPVDGHLWIIKTHDDGLRENSKWDSKNKKILVLGDSFAFGHGVNIEERFDTKIKINDYAILNTGVTGYGTDQQFLKSKPYLAQLKKGDVVIILTTTFNDIQDISWKQHSGRTKPWYELNKGKLKLHGPKITVKEIIRDKSYIYSKLARLFSKHYDTPDGDIITATNIYKKIIENETNELNKKGVNVILAYFGVPLIKEDIHRNKIAMTIDALCEKITLHCLNFNDHFNMKKNKEYYLSDGHWNTKGNEAVAKLLTEKIQHIMSINTIN